MRSYFASILIYLLSCINLLFAQNCQHSISVFGSITTSSKIYHSPHAMDDILRRQFFPLENLLGCGVEYRLLMKEQNFQIGLSIEYISKTKEGEISYDPNLKIKTRDGQTAIPVEITPYFTIPIGGQKFDIFIGGGAGIYIGNRYYEYGNAIARTVEIKLGAGIHIVSGCRYLLSSDFAIETDIGFRDIQFETSNAFSKTSTVYNGQTIPLTSERLSSLVNIDGMVFKVGTVYYF